jgi:hypothetical protein
MAAVVALRSVALADETETAYIPEGTTSSSSVNPWLDGSVCDYAYQYNWGNNTAYTAAYSDGSYVDIESLTYSGGYTSPSPPGVTIGYAYWSVYIVDSGGNNIASNPIPGLNYSTSTVTWSPYAIGSYAYGAGPYAAMNIGGVDGDGGWDMQCSAAEYLFFQPT